MKKVNHDLKRQLTDLHDQLLCAANEAEWAVERYNELATEYNDALAEVVNQIETYVDARSEEWQESERADDYAEWVDAFQEEAEEASFEWEEPDFESLPMELP